MFTKKLRVRRAGPRVLLRNALHRLGLDVKLVKRQDLSVFDQYPPRSLKQRAFLNVGAGGFSHPYFTNVDYASDWYKGIQPPGFVHYDLLELAPLPFESNSIEAVYSSHTIEHVPTEAVRNLARESFRVLTTGGFLRFTCPDADLLMRSVRIGARSYWSWREAWFRGPHSTATSSADVELEDFIIREIATLRCRHYSYASGAIGLEEARKRLSQLNDEEFLDSLIEGLEFDPRYPGHHMNWWSEEKLITVLQDAGFSTVYRSRRGQSLCPALSEPNRFDTTQPANSLYVEALKG